MRRTAALVVLATALHACALGTGIDPDTVSATTRPSSTSTASVDPESRLEALDITARLYDAILRRDGATVSDLATDPPGPLQDQIDSWANGIGLLDGSATIVSEAFTESTAQIQVRLELELLEVGTWTYETSVTLVGGTPWSALWSPSLLHPSMGPGDTLRVDRHWLPRASIEARDGTELAGAEPVKVVGVVPAWVEDLELLTSELSRLALIEPDTVLEEISRPAVQPDWFVPVGTIKPVVYAAVGGELEDMPGVVLRDGSERLSFQPGFAAHLLGTTGPITADQLGDLGFPYGPTDTIGQTGIEASFESQLAGRPRISIVLVNRFGRVLEDLLVVEAVVPQPVRTTIDIEVQTAIEQALGDDHRAMGVVVLDGSTSRILGAASRPLADEFDRAMRGAYPPGSTFKVVTATALLENGYTTATEVECPARVTIDGRVFRNAGELDLGTVSLLDAFAASCNTTFAQTAGETLSPALLIAVAGRFGFEADLDPGIPVASPRFPAPVDAADLAAAAIGQSRVLSSPLHMASVAGAVAAGAWRPPTVLSVARRAAGIEMDRSAVTGVADMMRKVVISGTGTAAQVPGLVVRGKTGSAEFEVDGDIATHAWFIAYWDDLAIAVVVEGGGAGGSVAAPIAAEIIARLS